MQRSKKQLKPEPLSSETAASPSALLSDTVHQFGAGRTHFEPSPLQQQDKSPRRPVSAWRDLLVTALWVVPAIGVLAYFVGVVAAIAAGSAIIVALGICVNSAIGDTIELDHTKLK